MECDKTTEDGMLPMDTSTWGSLDDTITIPVYSGTGIRNYTTMAPTYSNGITVEGDANFRGDLKVNGRSIVETLNAIEQRLSILTPDPAKLAKYQALQKAYASYKMIEAMCYDDE